jgi:hypothetical protein
LNISGSNLQDFMTVPIMSQAVFDDMDKNKDGFVSKGELKLAQRGVSMKDLADILQVGSQWPEPETILL